MSKKSIPHEFDLELTAANVKKAMAAAGAKSDDLWKVPRANIRILPEFNVRVRTPQYRAKVRRYADSMLRDGFRKDKPVLLHPVLEGDDCILYLIDGHRRLEAFDIAISEGAEMAFVYAVPTPPGTNMADLQAALINENEDASLTPYETAIVCKRMAGYGMSEKDIGTRVDYTPQYVGKLLRLLAAPKSILDRVIANELSANAALEALDHYGSSASEVIAKASADAKAAGKRVTPKAVKTAAAKSGKAPAAKKSASPQAQSRLPSVLNDSQPPRSPVEPWPFPSAPAAAKSATTPEPAALAATIATHAITDAERYQHLLSRIDTEIYFNGVEYQSKNALDAAIDADILALQDAGMLPISGR
ncbi:hypothetical protein [Paraburkholderia sp. J11-2]|uniref:ParB/RepB/Spo0J family partition protein n=1 Tax=Paraburkholderia sp. J11-2 TaxID=2805431 RepID=UPI002AB6B433|nr:hypothetical protein [Paraburkholderia sp. J11-2]